MTVELRCHGLSGGESRNQRQSGAENEKFLHATLYVGEAELPVGRALFDAAGLGVGVGVGEGVARGLGVGRGVGVSVGSGLGVGGAFVGFGFGLGVGGAV